MRAAAFGSRKAPQHRRRDRAFDPSRPIESSRPPWSNMPKQSMQDPTVAPCEKRFRFGRKTVKRGGARDGTRLRRLAGRGCRAAPPEARMVHRRRCADALELLDPDPNVGHAAVVLERRIADRHGVQIHPARLRGQGNRIWAKVSVIPSEVSDANEVEGSFSSVAPGGSVDNRGPSTSLRSARDDGAMSYAITLSSRT